MEQAAVVAEHMLLVLPAVAFGTVRILAMEKMKEQENWAAETVARDCTWLEGQAVSFRLSKNKCFN